MYDKVLYLKAITVSDIELITVVWALVLNAHTKKTTISIHAHSIFHFLKLCSECLGLILFCF